MSLDQIEYVHRVKCAMHPEGEICSAHWVQGARVDDFESHTGTFDIKVCRKCRMGLTEPYPSEETSGYLYDEKTSGDFDVVQRGWIDRLKDMLARRLLKKVSPFAEPSQVRRVLDYSCGNARFAVLAAGYFPQAQVDAVDYQAEPPPLLAAGRQARVSYFNIQDFGASTGTYDLIILRHVLEHTHRPIELIRFLGSKLTPEGVLYIEVPNLDAGCARLFGNKWKGYYVPRHIFHYSVESLHHIIVSAGLEGKIERTEMPLMGNQLAILLNLNKSNPLVQLAGIFLHPFQLAVEKLSGSSTCLNVRAKRPAAK